MNFTQFLPRSIARASSLRRAVVQRDPVSADSGVVGFDLLSLMVYMNVLASSGVSRSVLLEKTVLRDYKPVFYFKQVFLLAERLGIEYSRAFVSVGRRAKARSVRSLLLRLGGAAATGEGDYETIADEFRVEKEEFSGRYERSVEALKKWTDAYVAVLVSVTLIMVVIMISNVIFPVEAGLLVFAAFTVVSTGVLFAYVIYRVAPVEVKTYVHYGGSFYHHKAIQFVVAGAVLGSLSAMITGHFFGLGVALVVWGFCLLPGGLYSRKEDIEVDNIDRDLPKFIRALGFTTDALRTTTTEALTKMDPRYMGSLEPCVRRLCIRLSNKLSPDLSWQRFVVETGSELVRRAVEPFLAATRFGASGASTGEICSEFALTVSLLRARRSLVAASFAYLMMPMHAVVTGLLLFILEILFTFNEKLQSALGQTNSNPLGGFTAVDITSVEGLVVDLATIPFFHSQDLGIISVLTIGVILVLTLINSLVPWFATGGTFSKCLFYGSVMLVISGTNMIIIPPIVRNLFIL